MIPGEHIGLNSQQSRYMKVK